MSDLTHYREQATQARQRVREASSEEFKRDWLDIAESYEKLAEAAEKNARGD